MKKVSTRIRNTSFLISVSLHVLLIAIFGHICMQQSPKPKKDEVGIEVVMLDEENIPKPARPRIKDRIPLTSISSENRGQPSRRGDPNLDPLIFTNIQRDSGKSSKPKGSPGKGINSQNQISATSATAVKLPRNEISDVQSPLRKDRDKKAAGDRITLPKEPQKDLYTKLVALGVKKNGWKKGEGWNGIGLIATEFPEVVESTGVGIGKDLVPLIKGSGKIALILDKSGSMEETPLDLAKEALKYAIKCLNESDKFYLIAFNDQYDPYPKSGDPPVGKQDNGLESFIDGWQAGGSTAMLKTLKYALSSLDVNTILLISDGFPTDTDGDTILKEVGKHSKKIHTVALAFMEERHHDGADLLKNIAKKTGGKYKRINAMDYFLNAAGGVSNPVSSAQP